LNTGEKNAMTPESMPTIRLATPADAAVLSELGARTFTETFGRLYPEEDLREFLDVAHSHEYYLRALDDPDNGLWIVEADGTAIGYAQAGPCGLPHDDVAEGDGELKRLYVVQAARNGGIGDRLFNEVLRWLQRDGPRTLWIGVWSENHGAQRFYARHGFVRVGEYEFPVGGVRDREFILRR
jgi:ribosomal protein S18 acetylase RimI-like enzyme